LRCILILGSQMYWQKARWWGGGFPHSIWHCSPQHPPGETSCPWFRWVYSSLDKELAEWPSAESGGEWS